MLHALLTRHFWNCKLNFVRLVVRRYPSKQSLAPSNGQVSPWKWCTFISSAMWTPTYYQLGSSLALLWSKMSKIELSSRTSSILISTLSNSFLLMKATSTASWWGGHMHGHCEASMLLAMSFSFMVQNIPSSPPSPSMESSIWRLSKMLSLVLTSVALFRACSHTWMNGLSPTLCLSLTMPQSTKLPASVIWLRNVAHACSISLLICLISTLLNLHSQPSRHGYVLIVIVWTRRWKLRMAQYTMHYGMQFTQSHQKTQKVGTSIAGTLFLCDTIDFLKKI